MPVILVKSNSVSELYLSNFSETVGKYLIQCTDCNAMCKNSYFKLLSHMKKCAKRQTLYTRYCPKEEDKCFLFTVMGMFKYMCDIIRVKIKYFTQLQNKNTTVIRVPSIVLKNVYGVIAHLIQNSSSKETKDAVTIVN